MSDDHEVSIDATVGANIAVPLEQAQVSAIEANDNDATEELAPVAISTQEGDADLSTVPTAIHADEAGDASANALITTSASVDGEIDAALDASQDSAKKREAAKRRTSAVPEHKTKKQNKRKSIVTLQLDASPGDYYWAKLKGHPMWPSVIADEEMLPENMLRSRPVTAKDASGHYRDDYKDDGKNAKGRTYPIMYLGSNEFSWILNTDLTPLNSEDLENTTAKKTKALQNAYDAAKAQNDLSHYKKMLHDHQQAVQDEYARQQALEAEKLARKEKKTKRKSKDAVDNDGDVEMDDGTGDANTETKIAKKRKKEATGEDDSAKGLKTPKKIKVTMPQAVNGGSSSKSKAKFKAKTKTEVAAPSTEPKLSPEELRQKREKEILYFRHKLQKGFISRDSLPQDDEMKQMSDYFGNLEGYKDLDTSIIRNTKIHKVLKAIVKLTDIPRDDEFHFKTRAMSLLEPWQKALAEEAGSAAKAEPDVVESAASAKIDKPNGENSPSNDTSTKPKPETVDSLMTNNGPLSTDDTKTVEPSAIQDEPQGKQEGANGSDNIAVDSTPVEAMLAADASPKNMTEAGAAMPDAES